MPSRQPSHLLRVNAFEVQIGDREVGFAEVGRLTSETDLEGPPERPDHRFATVVLGLVVTVLFYEFFLSSATDRLVRNYIGAEYASQGAGIRVAMNILPAALFLLQQHRFGFSERERKVWRNFSLAAFLFLILLFVLPSTTAVDRLALYATPLQIAVLSRVPMSYRSRGLGTILIVLYSFAVQFVWFNYAANADAWIPYRIFPMGGY